MIFLEVWEPGDIPDLDGSRKILTYLDCMIVFGIVSANGLKETTPDQAAQWDFVNSFVPFGIPKIIVVDADGIFNGMFKKTSQETLLIPVHKFASGNHKEIINEGFNRYLKKAQKIK